MINTVIFDLDGLLVDSEGTWYQVFKDMLKDYGQELTLEEYVNRYSGKTVTDNISRMIRELDLQMEPEEGVERAISSEARHVEQGIELKEGVRELLQYLRENNYKIVLGTSSTRDRAMKILAYNQIDHYFDETVVGYEVERSKPFPDVFLAAAGKVGENPENCLVLEDSEAGIQAAYAANIPVICIPDLKRPRKDYEEKTAAVLPSLFCVIDYLNCYMINRCL